MVWKPILSKRKLTHEHYNVPSDDQDSNNQVVAIHVTVKSDTSGVYTLACINMIFLDLKNLKEKKF